MCACCNFSIYSLHNTVFLLLYETNHLFFIPSSAAASLHGITTILLLWYALHLHTYRHTVSWHDLSMILYCFTHTHIIKKQRSRKRPCLCFVYVHVFFFPLLLAKLLIYLVFFLFLLLLWKHYPNILLMFSLGLGVLYRKRIYPHTFIIIYRI